MKTFLLFLCLAGCLSAQPSLTSHGTFSNFSGSSVTVGPTTSFNCPAGSAIIATITDGNTFGNNSLAANGGTFTDSAGDTFTPGTALAYDTANSFLQKGYVLSSAGSASMTGSILGGTYGYTTLTLDCYTSGATAKDVDNAGATGSGTNFASASFSTAQATEVVETTCASISFSGSNTSTANSPSTLIVNYRDVSGKNNATEYWVPTTLQSGVTTSFTSDLSQNYACIVLSLKYPPPVVQIGPAIRGIPNQSIAQPVSIVASASTVDLTLIEGVVHITGTTSVNVITPPATFAKSGLGGCVDVIPDGAVPIGNTSSNILRVAATLVVNQLWRICFDNATAKWAPSY